MPTGHYQRPSLAERFRAKYVVDPSTGCWMWIMKTAAHPRTRPTIKDGPTIKLAYRVSWEMHRGPIPDGLNVCHRCDRPWCVNPDHLFVGTQAENLADMCRKGRHVKAHVIAPEWREKIRTEPELPVWAVAMWFGVSQKTIRNIRRGL